MTTDILFQTWPIFSQQIQALMAELDLTLFHLNCDHAAIRVNNLLTAQQFVDNLSKQGKIISNKIINGRPIYIIKLHQPLMLGKQEISCIELPFPSDKHYPNEGWEHIELVLPCQASNATELANALVDIQPKLAPVLAGKTEFKIKISTPKGDNEKLPNPSIAFKKHGLCIKIHPHSIETIIANEL